MHSEPDDMHPGRRIMVVDDELHVRKSIMSYLERHGYEVETFDNSSDALAAYRRNGCDLILTDVKMPVMNGVEFLGHIRDIDPDIPVILMTAYGNLELAVEAIKKGAFDFIIKPFEFEALLAAIAKGIRYRSLAQLEKDHTLQLEQALAEKVNELQAVHAQSVLSEKMATIGLLSAGVAHEINNPLAFIASNLGSLDKYLARLTDFIDWQTERMKSSCPPELLAEQEQYRKARKIDYLVNDVRVLLDESLEGVTRIRKIVASLKSFARKDDDVLELADLNELIESTLTIVWNEVKYVATLNREFGEIPPIRCYPSQLNQVIMNLLVNAAHAMKSEGTITVRTWQDGNRVCLAVSDTGCGMTEEIRSRIFEPFFTTKEAGRGTGLGLAISSDIIGKHNGTIDVASEVGKGTTFTVRLPLDPGILPHEGSVREGEAGGEPNA